MEKFTLGKYTLDDFADYLNGENNYFAGIEGNELVLTGEHKLTKTLNLHFPLTVTGSDDASITGTNDNNYAFSMQGSNTTVDNIHLHNVKYAVEIDAYGKCVENVLVRGITMHGGLNCIEVGSSVSGSTLRDIHVEKCTAIVAHEEWEQDTFAPMALTYNVCCVRHKGGDVIENCTLENFYLDGCKKLGQSRAAMNFMSGMPAGSDFAAVTAGYNNLVSKNINLINNYFETSWDSGFNVVDHFIYAGKSCIDGFTISGNYVEHGIAGVYMFASEPIFGTSNDAHISNVTITNNHFVRTIADVGEPTRGIWLSASRGDAFPGLVCRGSVIEDVVISNNKLEGAGIVLTGAYCMEDEKIELHDNTLRNVEVSNNTILRADNAFEVYGAQLEGRRYDWNFGFPRHDKLWGEEIVDDTIVTNVMKGNSVANIKITNNTVDGYRYSIKASGAVGRGHGVCENNVVVDDITFEGNSFGVGESHLHVADFVGEDFVRDNGGNKVSQAFKQRQLDLVGKE